MTSLRRVSLVALFAFLGGFAAQSLFAVLPAIAQGENSFFALYDAKNRKGLNAYVSDGQPGQVFYGENGKMRLQMGTYSGAGERGLPIMALSDTEGRIRMLFRLAGENESPVLILKDKSGSDRLVMGLGLNGQGQDPFLRVVDSQTGSKDIFGKYQ